MSDNKRTEINERDFLEWAREGVEKGWITPSFCYTHEGDPFMSLEETFEWDMGGDPCMVVFKIIV